jgi:uncharacterized protein involved in exopolysaccharide biosynthesis
MKEIAVTHSLDVAPRQEASPSLFRSGVPGDVHPVRAALGHWRLLLVSAVIFGGLAYAAAQRYSVRTWQARCAVLYAPNSPARLTRASYAPPATPSVISLLKCRANLEALSDEFQLINGADQLERAIKVNVTPNSDVIDVSCDWGDPQVAAALLNRLLAMHAERVNAMRREQLTSHAGALGDIQARSLERRSSVLASHDAVLAAAGCIDLASERDRAEKDLGEAQSALRLARAELASGQARVRDCTETLTRLEDSTTVAADIPDEATLALRTRREQLLNFIRDHELKLAEARRQAEARQSELVKLEPLVNQRVVPELDLIKVRDERDLFDLKADHAAKAVKEYRAELAGLPQEAAVLRKATAATALKTAQEKVKTTEGEVARAESRLAEKQQHWDKLLDLARRVRPLARKVEDADKEYHEISGEAISLDEAQRADQHDLVVVTPARPPEAPSSSSRGRILACVFGLPMLGLLGLLTGVETLRRARRPEAAARSLGLPILARGLPGGDRNVEMRRIAVRLCDRVGDASVMALTAAGSGAEMDELACHLGHYLALRGNRVLIIDTRTSHPTQEVPRLEVASGQDDPESIQSEGPAATTSLTVPESGVAERLLTQQENATDLIERTAHVQVDRLPLGGGAMTADLLASARMINLFDDLASIYNRVVVLAPSLSQPLEAELTLTHADIVFVTLGPKDCSVSQPVIDLVRSLTQTGVPLAGSVIAS